MHTIQLIGTIGDNKLVYEATMPFPTGWGHWELSIGDFHHGKLIFQQGEWRAYMQNQHPKCVSRLTGLDFYAEEIQVIIEEIERLKNVPKK